MADLLSSGDLSHLGSDERNSTKEKARNGPRERERSSHWTKLGAGVKSNFSFPPGNNKRKFPLT
jgi:hypothetical protein